MICTPPPCCRATAISMAVSIRMPKQAFLASPPLVVAYAIAGTIRFDIERDVLAVVDGKEIRLKDIWPSDEGNRRHRQNQRQNRSSSGKVYEPMLHPQADAGTGSLLYDWPDVDLHPPPAVLGRRLAAAHADRHAPAGSFADNITTDHLSPSNAILMNSAAGANICTKDGPAGRGLQLLRHPPRRPPDRATRDVCQPDAEKRNGGDAEGKVKKPARWRARRAGRQGDAHVGSDRNLYGPQTAADHCRRRRLRSGQLARLGGQGRASGGWKRSLPKASSASTAPT